MRWRETPKGKKHDEPSESVRPAIIVPVIDPKTGYFHVKFHEGSVKGWRFLQPHLTPTYILERVTVLFIQLERRLRSKLRYRLS
jgi:hypothetical protein